MRAFNPIAIGTVVAMGLTPIIMRAWARLAPVRQSSAHDRMGYDELKRRNKWLDRSFTVLMFVGLILFSAPLSQLAPFGSTAWLGGAAIGGMVLLPTLAIGCITLPKGRDRFFEFWRYYEKRWGIGIGGLAMVYGPTGILGLVSCAVIIIGHVISTSKCNAD